MTRNATTRRAIASRPRTRFQKGQSGNPRGQLTGPKNLKTLLSDALNEFVIVPENGGCRKITKREANITQLVNRSASRFSRDQDPPQHGAGYRRPDRAGICRDRLLQRGFSKAEKCDREPDPGAVRHRASARLRHLHRALLPRSKGETLLAALLPRVARWGQACRRVTRRPAKPI